MWRETIIHIGIPEMSDIMTYAHEAHITDHTYALICGVVRYVGKGFITVSQSSTHYELHYLEPYLDTAKKITADPNPVIFKHGIHQRWNRAIYVEDNLGTLTIHCGVRLYKAICKKYKLNQQEEKPL
jgi:hypothetical protein